MQYFPIMTAVATHHYPIHWWVDYECRPNSQGRLPLLPKAYKVYPAVLGQLADCQLADCHLADCQLADCQLADCQLADCQLADCQIAD